jgi:hypothetical protein
MYSLNDVEDFLLMVISTKQFDQRKHESIIRDAESLSIQMRKTPWLWCRPNLLVAAVLKAKASKTANRNFELIKHEIDALEKAIEGLKHQNFSPAITQLILVKHEYLQLRKQGRITAKVNAARNNAQKADDLQQCLRQMRMSLPKSKGQLQAVSTASGETVQQRFAPGTRHGPLLIIQ